MPSADVDALRSELELLGGAKAACEQSEVLKRCIALAWEQGWAWEVLCDAGQVRWIRAFESSEGSWVWGHGRQRGKSFAALALVDSFLRRFPRARARYCALTIRSARAIIASAAEDLYSTCPNGLRPKKEANSDDYLWPERSRLVVLGTDAETFRRGRGFSRIGLQVLDECGFYQDLHAVERALTPGLQVPGSSLKPGRNLYCSTPSESLAHPFVERKRSHMARRRLLVETFADNPRVDPEHVIASEMETTGMTREALLASSAFQREFLGLDIAEEGKLALPAWPSKAEKLVRIEARPQFFDGYEGLDIERELEARQKTVAQLAAEWKAATKEQWGHEGFDGTLLALADVAEVPDFLARRLHAQAPRQPFLRVGDDNMLVLAELSHSHGIAVLPTRKDEKQLAVDAVNDLVVKERLAIHPRCVSTIRQMTTTTWNRARNEWERTKQDHGEALDCIVYMARNVRWQRDPRPKTAPPEQWGRKPQQQMNGWNNAFGGASDEPRILGSRA
jgi:hypothetical protein